MAETNQNNVVNATSNNIQIIQNNQTLNIPIQGGNVEAILQNIIAERDALRTQNLSLWNIIEKQRTMIQKLQNQIAVMQSQKKKGNKHSEKSITTDDKKDKKGMNHPLPDIPMNTIRVPEGAPAPSQRGTSFTPQQRSGTNSSSQNQMGALLNEKYIRKGSAPNIKDHEVIYDLKNRVRSNSENALIEDTIASNYEMGTETINDTDNDDNLEDRPLRTDSSGNYSPPHPERLSSTKNGKNKQPKISSSLSIPIQVDTVRVKVIGSLIKVNEKGKEIVSFIILISRLNNNGNEENGKIEKTYNDFIQLDTKLRIQNDKSLVTKMGKLPDKNLFNSNSPTKRDQRKIELELYLQNLISVFKNNKDLESFLATNVVETQINAANNEKMAQSTKEGYLIKKGKNFGGWKTRYFVLADNIFSYYDSFGGSFGGTIKLKHSQVISLSDEANDYRHGFMIMEHKKQNVEGSNEKVTGKHILCAENDEERDEWIIALGQAIEAINQNPELMDSEKNSVNNIETVNNNENIYDSMDEVDESQPSLNFGSSNSIQNGYQNQMYVPTQPMSTSLKNKQQSIPNSQSSSYSEFDFQKSGDFVDENERLMQQVVEPPFGISTPSLSNASPSSQKKLKKPKEEKKKRLWGRNKNKQNENSKSGSKKLVFGLSLSEAIAASKIKANYELPAVVYRCIEYLDANDAQNEEGIYRLSGSASTIQALKDKFNNESDYDLLNADEYYDIHAVAGLLKLFLRELSEPILTRELQQKFLHIPELDSRNQKIYELANLISLLPLENYTLLRCLSAHLVRIVQNSSVNKMTLHNITIVFSPTLNIPAGVFMLLLSEFQIIFCWTNQQQLQQQLIPDEEQQKFYMAQQYQLQQQQMHMQQQQMYSPKLQNKTVSANNIQSLGNSTQNQGMSNMPHSMTMPLMQNLSGYNNMSNGSSNSSLSQDALPPKPLNPQINKLQNEHSNRNSVSYMDGLPEHMKLNEMMAMKKEFIYNYK
ncbi:RhoGAP-domain-containing protein [Neocallimastix sp. 'constans']